MRLVFFILIFLFLGCIFSKVSVDIKKFNFDNNKTNFKVKIKFVIYKILPIVSIYLTENGIKFLSIKISYNQIYNSTKFKKIINFINKKNRKKLKISTIKFLKPDLENINLKLNLGTKSLILTNFLIVLISTILSIELKKCIKNFDSRKYKYIIRPSYEEKNQIKLEFSGIFNIKISNLIEYVKMNSL